MRLEDGRKRGGEAGGRYVLDGLIVFERVGDGSELADALGARGGEVLGDREGEGGVLGGEGAGAPQEGRGEGGGGGGDRGGCASTAVGALEADGALELEWARRFSG